MLTSIFDFLEGLFHTVFNRTVENCRIAFLFGRSQNLNWRENCFRAQKVLTPRSNTCDSPLFIRFLRW
jgi:hypothetical protein